MRFGPLTFSEFTAFLPSGRNYGAAVRLTRFLAGAELDFDLQLVLKADEVPPCVLSTAGPTRPALGWTTWLKTRPTDRDDSQVVLAARN
jgi:type VI secretion system protein ImpH